MSSIFSLVPVALFTTKTAHNGIMEADIGPETQLNEKNDDDTQEENEGKPANDKLPYETHLRKKVQVKLVKLISRKKQTTCLIAATNSHKMYSSCENVTESQTLSICGRLLNETEIDDEQPLFDENLERIVQMTVFVLFGFIFVAGLIGNALVVIGMLN